VQVISFLPSAPFEQVAFSQEKQVIEQDFKGLGRFEWGLSISQVEQLLDSKQINYESSVLGDEKIRVCALQYKDSLFRESAVFVLSIDSTLGLYRIDVFFDKLSFDLAFDWLSAQLPLPPKPCGCDATKEFRWLYPTTDVFLYSRLPEKSGVHIIYKSNYLMEQRERWLRANAN